MRRRLVVSRKRQEWRYFLLRYSSVYPAIDVSLVDSSIRDEIRMDIHRMSLYGHPLTAADKISLERIMLAIVAHHPTVGYRQNLLYIAAYSRVTLKASEDDAFSMVTSIIRHVLPGRHGNKPVFQVSLSLCLFIVFSNDCNSLMHLQQQN